ncbi:MAG: hypothetical protein AUJ71_02710 [Candidatus Omnitrophica bacterium CG1_02_49_16]|nr:MAG: hypothetical protein AUJ71_02710 [Candidatus Omnitrophica bacterium CG1_02_49_16]
MLGLFFAIAALSGALYGMGFVVPLQGPWVDFSISKLLDQKTGFLIHCHKTKIRGWAQVSFDSLSVSAQGQPNLFVTGSGSIDFKKSHLTQVYLEHVRPGGSFCSTGIFSSWPIARGLDGKFLVNQLKAGVTDIHSEGLIRIFRCESDDFRLKGGLILKDQRIARAHFFFSLGPARLKKIPSQIRSRLIAEKEGWAGVHIIYCKNQLTLIGLHGPLFQAKWQGVTPAPNFH